MARHRILTIRCVYCGAPLVPNANDFPDWLHTDWKDKRKDEQCDGLKHLIKYPD